MALKPLSPKYSSTAAGLQGKFKNRTGTRQGPEQTGGDILNKFKGLGQKLGVNEDTTTGASQASEGIGQQSVPSVPSVSTPSNIPTTPETPITQDIPVELPEEEQPEVEMGTFFTDIPLSEENKMKSYLKANYGDQPTEVKRQKMSELYDYVKGQLKEKEIQKQNQPQLETSINGQYQRVPVGQEGPQSGYGPQLPTAEELQKQEEDKLGNKIKEVGKSIKLTSSEELSLKEGLKDVAKFGANVPGDTVEAVGDIYALLSDPETTVRGLLGITGGIQGKADIELGSLVSKTPILSDIMAGISGQPKEEFAKSGLTGLGGLTGDNQKLVDELGTFIKDNYGTVGKFKKALVENPVDTLLAVKGISQSIAKFAEANNMTKLAKTMNTIDKLSLKPITAPVKMVGKGTIKGISGASEYMFRQATGLDPETIKTIFKDPKLYEQAKQGLIDRFSTGEKTLANIKDKQQKVAGLGNEYNDIRKADIIIDTKKIDTKLEVGLKDRGINVNKEGVLDFTDSNIGNPVSKNTIQNAYTEIKTVLNKDKVTPNDVLNIRNKLDDLIDYKAQVPKKGQDIVKGLRRTVDDVAKEQVPALKELDAKFAPEIKSLNKIKKDYIDMDTGKLKDNALSKLANLTRKGNEQKLARVEELIPGVTKEIKAIKALEDVKFAGGNKVGTYMRAGLTVGGISTANPLMITAGLIASPQLIVPLIQKVGSVYNKSKAFINSIKNKIGLGEKLSKEEAVFVGKVIDDEIKLMPGKQLEVQGAKTPPNAKGMIEKTQTDKGYKQEFIVKSGYLPYEQGKTPPKVKGMTEKVTPNKQNFKVTEPVKGPETAPLKPKLTKPEQPKKGLPYKESKIKPKVNESLLTPEELNKKFTGRGTKEQSLKDLQKISPDGYSLENKINIDKLDYTKRGEFADDKLDGQIIDNIKKQYKKDGKIEPIIIDKRGSVVDGNHRVNAYKELGITEIPAYTPLMSDMKKFIKPKGLKSKPTIPNKEKKPIKLPSDDKPPATTSVLKPKSETKPKGVKPKPVVKESTPVKPKTKGVKVKSKTNNIPLKKKDLPDGFTQADIDRDINAMKEYHQSKEYKDFIRELNDSEMKDFQRKFYALHGRKKYPDFPEYSATFDLNGKDYNWYDAILGKADKELPKILAKSDNIDELYKIFNKEIGDIFVKMTGGYDRYSAIKGEVESMLLGIDLKKARQLSGKERVSLIKSKLKELKTAGLKPKPKAEVKTKKLVEPKVETTKDLVNEAKKYKSAEEFIDKNTTKLYHQTGEKFEKFDLEKSQGTKGVWFTNNKNALKSEEITSSGVGNIMERFVDEKKLKLAGWDEYEKYVTDQLIQKGYDGLKLPSTNETTYFLFDTKPIKTESELTKIREQANKGLKEKPKTKPLKSKVEGKGFMEGPAKIDDVKKLDRLNMKSEDVFKNYRRNNYKSLQDISDEIAGGLFEDTLKKISPEGLDSLLGYVYKNEHKNADLIISKTPKNYNIDLPKEDIKLLADNVLNLINNIDLPAYKIKKLTPDILTEYNDLLSFVYSLDKKGKINLKLSNLDIYKYLDKKYNNGYGVEQFGLNTGLKPKK